MINTGALIASILIAFAWVIGNGVSDSAIGAVGQLVGVTIVLYVVFASLWWVVRKIRGEPENTT